MGPEQSHGMNSLCSGEFWFGNQRSQVTGKCTSQDCLGYVVATTGSPGNLRDLTSQRLSSSYILATSKSNVIGQVFRVLSSMQSLRDLGCCHLVPSSLKSPSSMQEGKRKSVKGCTQALKCLDSERTQSLLLTLQGTVLDLGLDCARGLGNVEESIDIW